VGRGWEGHGMAIVQDGDMQNQSTPNPSQATPTRATPNLATPAKTGACSLSIDMVNPTQAGEQLRLDQNALLGLVNAGRLPAYNLGGQIRFRVSDVRAIAQILLPA